MWGASAAFGGALQGGKAEVEGLLRLAGQRALDFTVEARQEALAWCGQALRGSRALGDDRLAALSLGRMGLIYSQYGQFPLARDHCLRAEALCQQAGERSFRARLLRELGRIHDVIDRNREASAFYRQGLALYRELGDRRGEARAMGLYGAHLSQLGEGEASRAMLARALAICAELGDPYLEAQTLYHESLRLIRAGDYRAVADIYAQILPAVSASGDRYLEAKTRNNLGWAQNMLGLPHLAEQNLERAAQLYRQADHPELGACYMSVSEIKALYGERQETLAYLLKARDIFKRSGSPNAEASVLFNLAEAQRNLGDEESARAFYRRALGLFEDIGNRNASAMTLGAIGEMNLEQGRRGDALAYLRDALGIAVEIGNREKKARILTALGSLHAGEGRMDEALCFLEEALALQRRLGMRVAQMETLRELARAYRASGEGGLAEGCLVEALNLSAELKTPQEESFSLHELARLYAGRGGLSSAIACNRLALDAIESLRARVEGLAMRVAYADRIHDLYAFHIELLMRRAQLSGDQRDAERAFLTSERSRARTLTDTLSRIGRSKGEDAVGAGLIKARRTVQARLHGLLRQLSDAANQKNAVNRLAELGREIDDLLAEYKLLESQVHAGSARYAAIARQREWSLREIQNGLEPGTALLEFALGEERSFVWAITRDSFHAVELPAKRELDRKARRVYGLLTARNRRIKFETEPERSSRIVRADRAYWREAADLSRMAVQPALAVLPAGVGRLAIAADGALRYLPFGALPTPQEQGGEWRPLLRRYAVINLPSASVSLALQTVFAHRASAPKTLAVFGDPVFEADDPRIRTPRLASSISSDIGLNLVAGAERSGVFRRLIYTQDEVRAILELVPPGDRMTALGFEAARETALADVLSDYRIVHFATHGVVDSGRPDLAYLVFSQYDREGRPIDGVLSQHDIYGMSLNADLVVLSACRTALGREVRGEGLIGLARGFMYAGAPQVVASLWNIQDRATADLMARFYRGMLEDGAPPERALREAQLTMADADPWRAPYFWGAFTVQGLGRAPGDSSP